MKNNLIIKYETLDEFKLITDFFENIREMAKKLKITTNHCHTIICGKRNYKGYKYERVRLFEEVEYEKVLYNSRNDL